ncbi:MAG: pyridoxal phosphate-dependent aminotransferase [Oscillospiraceae bacterium]|nr:pyridoxal phosphate-dependent aminotransferase [Oscillospiraceae bacterium]
MHDHLNTALYALQPSPIRAFSALAAETPDCVRLTLGEPDFATPEPVCAAVSEALAAGETHYIENSGTRALREAIREHERAQHGFVCDADDVIVTDGANEALFVALFGILNPGDEVIVPTPAFVLYERIIALCRATFVPMDTTADGYQLREENLLRHVTPRTKAIVLNSPNNPTGCVLDRESLETVRRLVQQREIFVICDDVYRSLSYTDDYHSFSEFTDVREKTLLVQSFSKTYAMTGWRMGYLISDPRVRERLALLHQFLVTSTPAPFQRACIAALRTDPAPMRAAYAERRDVVLRALRDMGLETAAPQGAFYVFPSIRRFGMDSTTFCTRLLREQHVAVTPGVAFGADDHIRISYCTDHQTLQRGLDRLAAFVNSL